MSRKDESEAEQITCTSMADSERFGVIRRVVAGLRLSLAVVSCCGDANRCVSTKVSEIESNPRARSAKLRAIEMGVAA